MIIILTTRKKARVKNLKRKAAARNPDEFYFRMENLRTSEKGGISGLRKGKTYSQEAMKTMRLQDSTYLQYKDSVNKRTIEKLEQELALPAEAKPGITPKSKVSAQHTIFLSEEEEPEKFDPVAYFDTVPEALDL